MIYRNLSKCSCHKWRHKFQNRTLFLFQIPSVNSWSVTSSRSYSFSRAGATTAYHKWQGFQQWSFYWMSSTHCTTTRPRGEVPRPCGRGNKSGVSNPHHSVGMMIIPTLTKPTFSYAVDSLQSSILGSVPLYIQNKSHCANGPSWLL